MSGTKKFRAKVSQALREHQPFIKALMDIDDASANVHTEKKRSFPDLETISEQSPSASMPLPDLCNTEDRRRAFATSRVEPAAALDDEDNNLVVPVERGPNMSEFTVSEFSLIDGSFSTFPSSGVDECIQGSDSFLAQLPWDSFSGCRSSNSMISLYEALEDKDFEDGRIEWNYSNRDLVKRTYSHNNETPETKRGYLFDGTVKRCVLNRDKSDVARKLKEICSDFSTAEQPRYEASEMDFLLDAIGRSFVFP